MGVLECSKEPEKLLTALKKMLKQEGKLLLGTDNRLGIRYFCGDRDVLSGRNFDGIENYFQISDMGEGNMTGRAYSWAEIAGMLERAGFESHRFYSVMHALSMPQLIYAEDYLPEEELDVRYFPSYRSPDTVFLEEERIYSSLIQNGLFHASEGAWSTYAECLAEEDNYVMPYIQGETAIDRPM